MKTLLSLLLTVLTASAGLTVRVPSRLGGHGNFVQGTAVGNLSTSFPEPSGMARPHVPANAGYLWLEQDSGGPNTFLAVNASTAATAGSWTLGTLATQNDWEDCASAQIAGVNYLYMGDIGNNANSANSRGTGIDVQIFRCIEPTITGSNGTILDANIVTIPCAYPTGNTPALRDCECLLVDPRDGTLYLITKRIFPAQIYSLPHAISYAGTQTLTYVGKLAGDTSTTSLTIGTGSKVFTTANSLAYQAGTRLRAASAANSANYMEGDVTSVSGATLTLNCDTIGGSGTLSDWQIGLANSITPTGNNGCVTGGSISEDGSQIVICNYGHPYPGPSGLGGTGLFLWTRNGLESAGTALLRAPKLIRADTGGGSNYPHSNPPSFPQRESVEFSPDGTALYSIGEYYSTYGTTTNPLVKYSLTQKPVNTLVLQNGLNGYSGTTDTMITSAAAGAGTDNSATTSLVTDVDYSTTLTNTISSASSAAGGAQTTFVCSAVTGFTANKSIWINGSSVSSYNGTWKVVSVSSPNVTVAVPFNGTATASTAIGHTGTNEDRLGLVKFDISSVPAGSTIVGAKLVLYINTEGKSLQLNRVIQSWTGTSTWTSLTDGIQMDGTDATVSSAYDAALIPKAMDAYVGFITVNIPPATIQGWLDSTFVNQGWLVSQIEETTGDGFQFDSCESATQARKPMLIIRYTTP